MQPLNGVSLRFSPTSLIRLTLRLFYPALVAPRLEAEFFRGLHPWYRGIEHLLNLPQVLSSEAAGPCTIPC